jgi:redox-sensitive bicupin YhaK (pirin superfamily)
MQAIEPRLTDLGGLTVRRLLPRAARRLVGPWCFLDLLGPLSFDPSPTVDVPPHPHIGLQTVTWLLEGEMLHRDSLGSEALAAPGVLNLMTSGRGIAHSEETPAHHSGRLHAVQLWIALPDSDRDIAPSFETHASRPLVQWSGGRATVILGTLAGTAAVGTTFSPLVAAELRIDAGAALTVPLDARFEHAVVPLVGTCIHDDAPLRRDVMYYLAPGGASLTLHGGPEGAARVLLLGGVPFTEPIRMWWNFVARTDAEIAAARDDWQASRRFGAVRGYPGPRLEAPPFAQRAAAPNPMS